MKQRLTNRERVLVERIIETLDVKCATCPFRADCAADLNHPEITCEGYIAQQVIARLEVI